MSKINKLLLTIAIISVIIPTVSYALTFGEYLGAGSGTTKGLWHLNGDSTDSSGNGNNGTDTNITYGLAYGKFGQGASFNGTNSYISFGDPVSLQPTRPFTIIAWFNTTKTGTQVGGYTILRKRTGGYTIAMSNSDTGSGGPGASAGQITMEFWDGASDRYVKSTAAYNDGNWHCVVAIYGATALYLYIDGTYIGTLSNSSAVVYGAGATAIGRAGDFNGNYWSGSIDEVFIENTEWSAVQVQKYYTYAKGRFQ